MRVQQVEQVKAAPKTILLVVNERIVGPDIRRTLSDLGYSVPTTASSAEQALLLATERAPDLVLMDLRIKGTEDGIATGAILRKRFDVPVVYLTASADQATVARAKQTEPFACLLDPFTTNELRCAVEMALYKHEMDRELRARERQLTATMRAMSDGVIATDDAGQVTYMNLVGEELTGWVAADARGRHVDEVLRLVNEASRDPIPNRVPDGLREAHSVQLDGMLVRDGADDRFVSNRISPILGDDGAASGAVMVFRDMSQHRKLQRQLEMADRLATVGTMAAGVAHEVNNPLAYVLVSIQWALQCVRKRRGQTAEGAASGWMDGVVTALTDAETGASRVAKIVRDLNAFTRIDTEPKEPVHLTELIEWSLDVAGAELRPRARVIRRFGNTPLVVASPVRLGQVFVNLLVNAAQALEVSRFDTNEIVVSTRTDGQGCAVVEIRDNGCGMTREVMERAFEPFFTTKPAGEGTGLGLSICHGITESLGGNIVFASERGKGTLARVSLPPERSAPAARPS